MAEIGLFPLELVLLPTERIPLHIFEPRYRELIGECIDEEREFGLVLAATRTASREIGTMAAVVEVLQVLRRRPAEHRRRGRRALPRRRITDGRSFLTAEVEPVDDEPTGPTRTRRSSGRSCSSGGWSS